MLNKEAIVRNANLAKLLIKKNEPTILTAVGVIGLIGAGVWACKSTLKAETVVAEAKDDIEEIKSNYIPDENEKEYKKALTQTYVKTAADVVKVYAGPVIVATVSAGMIFAGDCKHRERYASVCAAYTTLDQMFRRYRDNVKEAYGEEVDYNMRHSIKKEKIEVVDPETGKKTKKEVNVVDDPNMYSDYSRFYDASCREWDDDPEYNMCRLKSAQNSANETLKSRGYIYLNEVYDMLGIPLSKAGQRVGWFRGFGDDLDGDGYVDFGLYDDRKEAVRRFVNGYEPVILLDFNVDGVIDEKVEEYMLELAAQRRRLRS